MHFNNIVLHRTCLPMHVLLWLSLLLLLYIVRNDENKDDQSVNQYSSPVHHIGPVRLA